MFFAMKVIINKPFKLAIIWSFFGIFLLLSGCVLGFKVFRIIVRGKIAESVELKENTLQWNRFVDLPFPISFNVYLFNVTNPDKILQGSKPDVVEIGPYVYKQSRKKKIVDVNNDTVSYYQFVSHEFDLNKSKPLMEDDTITILNVPFNSLIQIAEKESPYSLTAINNAWRQVFNNEESIFHSVTIKEYLFGGYKFCRSANLNSVGKLVCREINKRTIKSKNLDSLDDGSIQFSLLGYKHNHHDGLYEIRKGIEDVLDVGIIKRWNNLTSTKYWSGNNNECDRIFGTDASIYPPYSTSETIFTAFSTDICRKVKLYHKSNIRYDGVAGLRYEQQEDVFNGKEDCFCTNQIRDLYGKIECLPIGFNDIFNCLDAPILISNPHLFRVDSIYQRTVNGLLPDKEKHTTFIELEPDTGTPLRAGKRVQFNMILRPIKNMKIIANVTPSIIPIMWIDEHFNLPLVLMNELKTNYLKKLLFLNIIKWSLIIGGFFTIVISIAYQIYLLFVKKEQLFVKKSQR